MNRAPTYTPPPAPLGPPPVPTPPAPLPPLTVAEKGAHVVGLAVAWGWLGLVGVTAWGAVQVGFGAVGGVVLVVGAPPGVLGLVWALLPLWGEVRQRQAAHSYHQDAAYHWQAHYAALLAAQEAWQVRVLGATSTPPADEEIVINGRRYPAVPTVLNVTTPDAPDTDPPPGPSLVDLMRGMVERFRRQPAPDPVDAITTRLPALPPGVAPRIRYSPDLRAVVDCFLLAENYSCSGPDGQAALGVSDRQWRALCQVLTGAGVLVTVPGKERRLSDRVIRLRYDNADPEIHAWVKARLAK